MPSDAMAPRAAPPPPPQDAFRFTLRDFAALCCETDPAPRRPTPRRPRQGLTAVPAAVPTTSEPDPLGRLMAAAQAGDARAYDTLLRAVLPLLRGIARRRLFDAAEAEDAVQDALLSLHALRHTYDPSRPFRAWLTAIAERRAIDRLRRSSRRGRREVVLDDVVADRIAGAGAREAEAGVHAAELRQAVAALPSSQRTALCLAKLEDLSLADASARSGLSVAALKVATHRALATLRRRLCPAEA